MHCMAAEFYESRESHWLLSFMSPESLLSFMSPERVSLAAEF